MTKIKVISLLGEWIILVSTTVAFFLICHFSTFANTLPDKILSNYSTDYQESRNKFLAAARKSGGRIDSYQNPTVGPDGEALYVDVLFLGANDPKAVLALVSGTHGIEGFAGSAIQTGLLRQGIASTLAPHVGLVMIHAINPYGFAHLRRVNEDNVDLNRNFLDHSKQHPSNKGYKQLADAIAPLSLSLWNNVKSQVRIIWYRFWHGTTELRSAVSGGQYTHPNGLFYGGSKPTWSNKIIKEVANRYLIKAKRVVVIDFHSGLGSYGNAEVIMNVSKESPAFKRAKKWGREVKSTVTGDSVSPHLHGSLKLAFPEMLPDTEVTTVSLEFGTLSRKEVLWALRSENWLYHHGGKDHPDANKIKNNLLHAFYPDDNNWKLDVWRQGKKIVEEVLKQL
jgi:predicted deacylase